MKTVATMSTAATTVVRQPRGSRPANQRSGPGGDGRRGGRGGPGRHAGAAGGPGARAPSGTGAPGGTSSGRRPAARPAGLPSLSSRPRGGATRGPAGTWAVKRTGRHVGWRPPTRAGDRAPGLPARVGRVGRPGGSGLTVPDDAGAAAVGWPDCITCLPRPMAIRPATTTGDHRAHEPRHHRPPEVVRGRPGPRRHQLLGRARPGLRLPRRQRRRQDDRDADRPRHPPRRLRAP